MTTEGRNGEIDNGITRAGGYGIGDVDERVRQEAIERERRSIVGA